MHLFYTNKALTLRGIILVLFAHDCGEIFFSCTQQWVKLFTMHKVGMLDKMRVGR